MWNVSKRSACSNRRRLGAIREMAEVDARTRQISLLASYL
ncbi:hypothetical protein HMPREF1556_01896 [Porphyromonas sp. oral taxon 278 str. W7784]|nr:hypothetical protein HMPREF1556_01896 [Porphyromonas sp. oral taxon 278 str. W7784]